MPVLNGAIGTEATMTRFALVLLIAGLAWLGAPAQAPAQGQDPPASASEDSRYTFHRIRDGFVRLDGRTGQVAQCGWNTAGWSCNAVPDERAALETEIARLQRENAALKRSLLAKGIELPSGIKPEVAERKDEPTAGKSPDPSAGPRLPSDAELDQAMAFMKKVWRRLIEMMADLQRDVQRKS